MKHYLIFYIVGILSVKVCAQKQESHQLVIHPRGHKSLIFDMVLDPEKNIVTGSFDKNVFVWNPESGGIIKEFRGKIGPGSEGMIYAVDVSPDGQYLAVGGWLGKDDESEAMGDVRLYSYKTGKMLNRLMYHENVVYDLHFSPDSRYLVTADASGNMICWDLHTWEVISYFDYVSNSFQNMAMADDYFVTAHADGMVYKWKYDKKKPDKKLKFFEKIDILNIKAQVEISADGKTICIAGKEIGMILVLNDRLKLKQYFFVGKDENAGKINLVSMALTEDGSRIAATVSEDGDHSVRIYDLNGKAWNETSRAELDDLTIGLKFINHNLVATAGGRTNEINTWEIEPGKLVRQERMKGVGTNYYAAAMHENELAFSNEPTRAYGNSEYERIFDLFDRKIIEEVTKPERFNRPIQEQNGIKLYEYNYVRVNADDPSQVLLINKNGQIRDSIVFLPWTGNQFYTYTFLGDKYIVIGGSYGVLQLHDLNGKLLTKFVGHEGGLRSATVSSNGKFLVTSGIDMTVRFWSLENIDKGVDGKPNIIEPTASLFIAEDGEWILWNREGYFTASKKGARYVGYHVNFGKDIEARFYPFDQFDLKYNRPDILMEDLEMADAGIIELYRSAYMKRLKRMGITEAELSTEIHTPEVTDFKVKKEGNNLTLKIEAEDSRYPLNSLQVYMNDVPIYGRKGKKIESGNTYKGIEIVQLIEGKNKVEVSVLNERGVESLRETVFIEHASETPRNLYVAAIGVSDYQDKNFNLSYAAKDALDVKELFQTAGGYHKVYHKTLLNKEVNRKNVYDLKDFFKDARPNDIVVLFIAGHGVLDQNFDYYFCTHDMDFMNPSKKGVSYAELEQLFDGISAIRKLLIMDTCHSGELYKDEVEEVQIEDELIADNITFRSTNATTTLRERQGLRKTNEAVKEMFNDLNRGTGTTVISSAGGVEYAMESEQWENGLFTYCLIRGLSELKADEDKNGEVTLSELQDYIHVEVSNLSNGKQTPTSRFENLSLDYRLW